MPPIDASIPLGIKQPDQMQNLSGLLNIARGTQLLQQDQQQAQQGAIDLQERQSGQGILSDPKNYTDDAGNFDMQKAQKAIMPAMPTTGAKVIQNLAYAHQQGIQANQFLNSLTTENREQIGRTLYSMLDAPPDVVEKGFDALGKQYKGAPPITDWYKKAYQTVTQAHGPQAAKQFLARVAQSTMPQNAQQDLNTPSGPTLTNNQESVIQNTKPNVAGVPQFSEVPGTRVVQLLPRSQQDATSADAMGNPAVVHKDAFGNVTGMNTMPGTSSAPGSGQPYVFPPGENADTLKAAQQQRLSANRAAASTPAQVFNNNAIIKLAPQAGGVQWMDNVRHILGGSGVAITNASDPQQVQQQLGHYLALQTSQLAQSAGINSSDAGQAVAAAQAGDRNWGPQAQQSTARVNRALAVGAQLYNQGVEAAFQNSKSDPFSTKRFQNQWSQAASLDALRLYDAVKNKAEDPEGVKALLKEWGGVNSSKYKQVLKEVDRMGALLKQAQ